MHFTNILRKSLSILLVSSKQVSLGNLVRRIRKNDISIRLLKGFVYYTSITKFKINPQLQAAYADWNIYSL